MRCMLFFLSCRATGFLFLFLFATPLGASFLAVAPPLVTPLHPLRLRIGICRDQHRCRYYNACSSRQAQKRKCSSTRNQFKFDAFTHLSLLPFSGCWKLELLESPKSILMHVKGLRGVLAH